MKKLRHFLALATTLLLVAPLAQAELPELTEKPWLGHFIGIKDRKFQFGITSKGKAVLHPLNSDGAVQSLFNPVRMEYGILETNPDGTTVIKKIQPETLSSEQPATDTPKAPVKFTGKVTGDAAFEVTIASERGGFSVSGKVTDKGSLDNARFFVFINITPYKQKAGKAKEESQEDAIEKFKKKLKRDELRLKTVEGKAENIGFLEKHNLATQFPGGFRQAQVRTAGYGGVEFSLEATGDSELYFEDQGEREVWNGFPVRWFMHEGADPSKAKLIISAK